MTTLATSLPACPGRLPRPCTATFAYAALGAVSLAAVAAIFFPALPAILQLDRASPDLFRLVTAHLVHWTPQHLFWDLSVFVLLSLWLIPQSPARYLLAILASPVAISLGVTHLALDLQTYRGLSGVDCALTALAIAQFWVAAWQARSTPKLTLASVALLALIAKTLYDLSGHPALFAGNMGADVIPVPLAHLIGIATGLIVALPLHRAAPAATLSQDATTRT